MAEHTLPQFYISYGDRPSQATLFDWATEQFVLLKSRSDYIGQFNIELAMEVLEDIDKLCAELPNTSGSAPHYYLQLRGIWFGVTGGVSIHVEHLYTKGESPYFTEQQLLEALHDNSGWYSGQMIDVQATITPVEIFSDHFSPISDHYYDRVKPEMFWNQ